MELLSRPKSRSTVIRQIKDVLFSADKTQSEKNHTAMAEAFYTELTKRMEQLGYVRNKQPESVS
nr:hypothetical protein [Veillonella denticariosi]